MLQHHRQGPGFVPDPGLLHDAVTQFGRVYDRVLYRTSCISYYWPALWRRPYWSKGGCIAGTANGLLCLAFSSAAAVKPIHIIQALMCVAQRTSARSSRHLSPFALPRNYVTIVSVATAYCMCPIRITQLKVLKIRSLKFI
jgi:hypothetical protein